MKLICMLLLMSSCYAEWDVPKTPRHDECTGAVELHYVYVQPTCRAMIQNPRDYNDSNSQH